MHSEGIERESKVRSVVQMIGIAVSLAALAFVGMAIHRSFGELQQQLISPLFLAAVAGGAVAYAAVLQLIGLAWHRLLAAVDDPALPLKDALAIFGRTQIYKYLPSNVLHMVGRFAMARKAGVSNRALAFAQVGELSILVLAATAMATLLSKSVLVDALARYGLNDPMLITALMATGFIILAVGIILLFRSRMASVGRKALSAAAMAFFLYILFFIGNGLLIVVLCRALNFGGTGSTAELIGIGAAAWLIGFVVPGAPGGLGVREAVLIAGLSAAGFPAGIATAVALGNRLVTILGDGMVALCEFAIRRLW
ncbi:lysylphosphatidylglycerol synthase domain-containing protein [Phyllobacterium salinisoli]|nr:lysylphosphatidylglycerol synthase domain-containing protein [Phyllobacterium salinisoli]